MAKKAPRVHRPARPHCGVFEVRRSEGHLSDRSTSPRFRHAGGRW
jgi:hypothetical protein